MGYLTTISIHNDAQGAFEDHPAEFGKAILAGIAEAEMKGHPVTVPFQNYANYIEVFPPRHADDHTVYFNRGNSLTELGRGEWKGFVERLPQVAEEYLVEAERIIKDLRKQLKKKDVK
jgi:hypothetical protein